MFGCNQCVPTAIFVCVRTYAVRLYGHNINFMVSFGCTQCICRIFYYSLFTFGRIQCVFKNTTLIFMVSFGCMQCICRIFYYSLFSFGRIQCVPTAIFVCVRTHSMRPYSKILFCLPDHSSLATRHSSRVTTQIKSFSTSQIFSITIFSP